MTVIGYHGTNAEGARGIISTKVINPSSGNGHWLGTGAYFFQDAPERAAFWARYQFDIPYAEVRVFRCEIDLSSSLDLFDRVALQQIKAAYGKFEEWEKARGISATQPRFSVQKGHVIIEPSGQDHVAENFRDHLLLDWYVAWLKEEAGENKTAIRGAFLNGTAVYEDSFLFNWSHVQIAVRDNAIYSEPVLHSGSP